MAHISSSARGHDGARGWFHTHGSTLVDLFRLVDAALIFLGLWLSCRYLDTSWDNQKLVMAATAVGFFTFFVCIWPLYRSWRFTPLREELTRISFIWLASIAGVSFLANALIFGENISIIFPTWALTGFVLLIGTRATIRIGLRSIRVVGSNFRTAAIIGANKTGANVASQIHSTSWMGVRLVGFYDDRSTNGDEERRHSNIEVAGSIEQLIQKAKDSEIDIIYIALPLCAESRIENIVSYFSNTTATIYFVPNFSVFGLLSPSWDSMGGMPIVSLVDTPHHGIDAGLKRILDIVLSTVGLLIVAIPMLIVAIAIKLTSKGPIIFKQKRYGLDGKKIDVWKLRTMTVCENGDSDFQQATQNDTRITPLGSFLRRSSVDELPQLVQVLKGDMSLVGPRPHPIALNESHRKKIERYMLRHKVKPGLTGWAQVNGYRGETDTSEKMEKRIEYDLEYINNWSIGLDLRIIFLTAGSIFNDPNAY